MKNTVFAFAPAEGATFDANAVTPIDYTVQFTVAGVSVYEDQTSASVKLRLPKPVPGYEGEDRKLVMVKELSWYRSSFTGMVCDVCSLVRRYRAANGGALNKQQIGYIFDEAKITVVAKHYVAGECIDPDDATTAVEKDCYIRTIVAVELCDFVEDDIKDALKAVLKAGLGIKL